MPKTSTGFIILISVIFLVYTSQPSAATTDISSSQNGDIDLGTGASDSLNLNSNGILTGNITMGNSGQIATFNGGVLNGTINGAGEVIVAENVVLNGNIGASDAVSSVTVNDGKTLDLTTNNNTINSSGALSVGSGSSLLVGSGTVSASIRGASDGVGTVKFNANNTLGGSVGTSTTTLSLIEIGSGATVNTNTRNIDATTIAIADNGVFSYGSGSIAGEVEGKVNGVGIFVFNNTKTTTFSIGQNSKSLASISVLDGATVTLGDNVSATTVSISGTLKSNTKTISASNINIASGATLNYDVNSAISGAINGSSSGIGKVQFSGSQTGGYVHSQSLGSSSKLAEILISNETSLAINSNIVLNADIVTIGDGSSGGAGTPILTQNDGTIGADANSFIKLNTDAVFNYNGGTINGILRGTSSGKGTFNINHDYTNSYELGQSYALANLSIASSITLTANSNISANNISIAGNLNLGNSGRTITGSLLTSGGAASIDMGAASHTISGNFSTLNGDILKINALDNTRIGNLKIAGSAAIVDGTKLKITFNPNNGYLSRGTKIAIIAGGAGSVISAVDDTKIDLNNSGSNHAGLLTFKTEQSGNNLFLVVDRKGAENFSSNQFVSTIYSNIDQAGSSATGSLRNLQKFIDDDTTTDAQRESVLKSTIPQVNADLHNSAFSASNSSINISTNRLQNTLLKPAGNSFGNKFDNFLNQKSFNNFSDFSKKTNIANLDKISFSDEIFDKQAIWMQEFGTAAEQKNVGDVDGYNLSHHGLAIGVDQEVANNLRLGISSSFSTANTKSKSTTNKETDIDSYQFNLYGGYNFAPYFVTGILGLAINKYTSTRAMPDMHLVASANYSGETYIAKFESGMIKNFACGLAITPKLSLTAAKNQIETYAESGANTLNLTVSNQSSNFLEGRVGSDLSYDDLKISSVAVRPKIKASYGYDFLGGSQSSSNRFQGQSSTFQIKNSNIDKTSLKYGLGLDVYWDSGILVALDYELEQKSSYQSQTASIYARYDF